MPVINLKEIFLPQWSELDFMEFINLRPNASRVIQRISDNEILFAIRGNCNVSSFNISFFLLCDDIFVIDRTTNSYNVKTDSDECVLLRVCGKDISSCGVFQIKNSKTPRNKGYSAYYECERKTEFDNHFHDCDEYWIFYRGRGRIATEGKIYEVKAGDCVATLAGDYHDVIEVFEELHGVYVETSLKGEKRTGHLWNKTYNNYEDER